MDILLLCNKCAKEKPKSEFYTRKDTNSVRAECKKCLLSNNSLYHQINSLKISDAKKEYYKENKSLIKKKRFQHYMKNKDKIRQKRTLTPHRFDVYKRGAKIRNLAFAISIEDFERMTSQRCFYCNDFSDRQRVLWN